MRQKPKQARSRMMVDSIVDATMLLIDERGVADMTTTHVADRAGISVGSLYQYFDDKEALFDAVTERMSAEVHKLLFEQFDKLMGADLRTVARGLLSATFDYVDSRKKIVLELLSVDSQRRTVGAMVHLERGFMDAFRVYLLEHHREIVTRRLSSAVFVVFTSSIATGFRFAAHDHPGVNREDVIDLLVDSAVACLTGQTATAPPAGNPAQNPAQN